MAIADATYLYDIGGFTGTYFSEVLLYAGLLVLSLSLMAAAVWLRAVVFLRSLCRHEEQLLVERFGEEYRAYMREVPTWIPAPGRRPRS